MHFGYTQENNFNRRTRAYMDIFRYEQSEQDRVGELDRVKE